VVVWICDETHVVCLGEHLVEVLLILSVYVDQLVAIEQVFDLFFFHGELFPAEILKHLQQRCVHFQTHHTQISIQCRWLIISVEVARLQIQLLSEFASAICLQYLISTLTPHQLARELLNFIFFSVFGTV